MATRSLICKETLNHTYVGIYCHWDGYPLGVGRVLCEHYTTKEKVEALLELGDLSSLGSQITPPEGSTHSFDEPMDDVCVAYHRDRGEEYRPPCPIRLNAKTGREYGGTEYMYVFMLDGTWQYCRLPYGGTETPALSSLAAKLAEEERRRNEDDIPW